MRIAGTGSEMRGSRTETEMFYNMRTKYVWETCRMRRKIRREENTSGISRFGDRVGHDAPSKTGNPTSGPARSSVQRHRPGFR